MTDNLYKVKCITPGAGHYFHGFYNIQPWDAKERYFFCHKVDYMDRMPGPKDKAVIGIVDMQTYEYLPLDETYAWNFQLGCLAHWVGDRELIYNVRNENGFASVILDVFSGKKRSMPQQVYTVSSDGKYALGYDFARSYPLVPGYSYAGVPYNLHRRLMPDDEGIMRLDIEAGKSEMLLSYKEIAERYWIDEMEGNPLYLGRLLYNKSNTRIIFSFRFLHGNQRYTNLITCNTDGSQMYQLVDFYAEVAHFDWCGDGYLLAWSKMPGTENRCFNLIKDHEGTFQPVGKGVLTVDGHCSYSPDGKTFLMDTFPQPDGKLHLILYDIETEEKTELGRFRTFNEPMGDLRCDLHPCWNRSGGMISFDSVHEGKRGVYIITDV